MWLGPDGCQRLLYQSLSCLRARAEVQTMPHRSCKALLMHFWPMQLRLHTNQGTLQAPGHRLPCVHRVARVVVCLLPAHGGVISWLYMCRMARLPLCLIDVHGDHHMRSHSGAHCEPRL